MLELMASEGMRIGAVLKLKAKNVYDRKLFRWGICHFFDNDRKG